MRRGKKTDIPGVTRNGDTFTVRLSTVIDGRRSEIERKYEGVSKTEIRKIVGELQRELDDRARNEQAATAQAETLTDFAKRWLAQSAATGRARPHTIANRAHHLERFILPIVGHLALRSLRRSHLSKWMIDVSALRQTSGPDKGRPYRRHTLMTSWATLRAMVKRAVVLCDLSSDPTQGLRFEVGDVVGDEVRPARHRKSALGVDELRRLLEAAKTESPDIRTMLVLGFATGMRFCELSALEWGDVDLDAGHLEIRRSQVNGRVGPPKTESTRRHVYLPPEVADVLRAHRRWQLAQQVVGLKKGLLFPSNAGTFRYPAVLVKPLRRCCALAGIEKRLTAHCMRKTTNNLLRQAAGDTVARAMIGHATEEMTRLYSDVDKNERARAHAAAFRGAFAPSVGSERGVPPTPHENDG